MKEHFKIIDQIRKSEKSSILSNEYFEVIEDDQLNMISTKDSSQETSNALRKKFNMEDLNMNLNVKETVIQSISDNLVLKEAEIARLKSRIFLMETSAQIKI